MTHTCDDCGESFESRSRLQRHDCSSPAESVGENEDASEPDTRSSQLQSPLSHSHMEQLCEIFQELVSAAPWHPNQGFEDYTCELIAASDLYEYAWIGTVHGTQDTFDACYGANLPAEYLQLIQKQHVSDVEDGVVEQALQTERVQIRHRAPGLERSAQPDPPDSGPESTTIIALPIIHGTYTHGVLVINTDEGEGLTDTVYRWFETLGVFLGLTINAIRQQELLYGHNGIELELRIPDSEKFFATISEELDCRCIHVGDEISEDRDIIHYHRIQGTDSDAVVAAATESDEITYHEVLSEEDDGFRFKSTTTESFVLVCLDFGGHIRHGIVENGTAQLTLELPLSADIPAFIDKFQTKHPALEVVAKREIQTGVRSLSRAGTRLHSGEVLTNQQRNAIEAAFRRGYYEWPREQTAEEIADAMGITPPTFHRHRRDAEQKLIQHTFFSESYQN